MSDIETIHENDEYGEQHTRRIVTITDATGEEFEHEFREQEDGHEYLGEGEPPKSALEALEDYDT
ncbi:hypothetical protein GJ633_04130 [Halorubrum sp. CBA1125]|uniref:hypothetical protein n=1 Tax=Halorubrum sp. CBA1125 TaxID=2668072 RepID=UPI0012E90955|nr:hypothetical protein [Halorubrum sp. CBA1125]MUW13940.1 hypothetical protein [Halorubrum sp. CBA1125]